MDFSKSRLKSRHWVAKWKARSFPALFCGTAANGLELRQLQGMATQVCVGSGKTIFSEGEPADSVFGLSHGVVRLYKQLTDGRRQVLSFALAGDFLGMPIAERHRLSADAVGEVSLCQFSATIFWNSSHPART